jgi:FixJ family two-component response regulator
MKLAVVDDDADVRTAINRLLRALGHEVSLFASAEEFTVARR